MDDDNDDPHSNDVKVAPGGVSHNVDPWAATKSEAQVLSPLLLAGAHRRQGRCVHGGVIRAAAGGSQQRADAWAAAKLKSSVPCCWQGRMGDEDDALMAVSSEPQREAVSAALSQAEDWLYVEGADEQATAYRCAWCQTQLSDVMPDSLTRSLS